MTTENQKKAVARYDKANTRQFKLKLNRNTDKDIIEYLETLDNVQGYLKTLIRQDMKSGI